ncbi:hypothetical protein ACMHYB_10535 [Sorangium sp. So ce1128]
MRTDHFDGQAFSLTGPDALTYAEPAAILSRASGRTIRHVDVADAGCVQGALEAGITEDHASYLAALFGFVRQDAAAAGSTGVATFTGRAPRTLAKYAQDHAAAWRAWPAPHHARAGPALPSQHGARLGRVVRSRSGKPP